MTAALTFDFIFSNPKYCWLKLWQLWLFCSCLQSWKAGRYVLACLCFAYGLLLCLGLLGFYVWCRCQNTVSSVRVVVSFQLILSSAWMWMQNMEIHISLFPVQVNGDIPPRLKKSAHEIILDFIRSRPPLNPVCNPVNFIPNKTMAF